MAKVLIVDDEYAFADFAKMLLESLGHEAVATTHGKTAAARAAAEKPDLILMDMHLEDSTGVEAIRLLKSDPATAKIPVVLCSISVEAGDVDAAMKAGAVRFLPKPIKTQALKACLQEVLG